MLASLVHDLRQHEATKGIDVFAFLENVAAAPPEVLNRYSEWLGAKPVLIDAASRGWVSRRRAFWVTSRRGGLGPEHKRPTDWTWTECEQAFVGQLQYSGAKPVPWRVFFEQGFSPLWSAADVLRGLAKPFFVFSREFYHPCDHLGGTSAAAVDRFHADCRRFPVPAYEESSLLCTACRYSFHLRTGARQVSDAQLSDWEWIPPA